MKRRVIVTRPAREALRSVAALRAAGHDAVALPLIAIEPVADAEVLQQARARLGDWSALMFVSAAAASHFFADSGRGDTAPRCWATGPGTVRALHQAGVPQGRIDAPSQSAAQLDSEALWSVVQAQVVPGARVLIVRGGDAAGQPTGRDWLAREIEAAGGMVDTVVAYRRLPPVLDAAQRRLAAEAAGDGTLWLFSSAEAIGHLSRAMPDQRWAQALAIATHPRIAEAARTAGFGTVRLAAPGPAAMAASIESFG